jgi:hypothetical protein
VTLADRLTITMARPRLQWAVAAIGVLWSANRIPAPAYGWLRVGCPGPAAGAGWVRGAKQQALSCRPWRGRLRADLPVRARSASQPSVLLAARGLRGSAESEDAVRSSPCSQSPATPTPLGLVNKQVYQDALQCVRLAWHRRRRLLPAEDFSVACF